MSRKGPTPLSIVQQAMGIRALWPVPAPKLKRGQLVWIGKLQPTPVSPVYTVRLRYDGIVPYVVQADGTEVIVNRTTDEFEETNPIGFTSWLQEKDVIAGGELRKVIRLLKYLRDHRGAFATKSILLTTGVGERVEQWRKDNDASDYADVPTTLLHVVKDLDEWLQARPTMAQASIGDPSCPNTTFDHRWTDTHTRRSGTTSTTSSPRSKPPTSPWACRRATPPGRRSRLITF